MTFRVGQVVVDYFPDPARVREVLEDQRLPEGLLVSVLKGFASDSLRSPGRGYQKVLAAELAAYLRQVLAGNGVVAVSDHKYCSRLKERADVVLARDEVGPRVFFEIEFRPNVEKDLVKFQIGHNSCRLAVGILIMAADRQSINPEYTTMPVFSKFRKVIRELSPSYPLLLCGISGVDKVLRAESDFVTRALSPRSSSPRRAASREKTNYGRFLNEEWGVGARHALYHKDGNFYMPLQRFPGAYFDPRGYVLFKTDQEFLNSPYLKVGDRVNVPGGLSSVPGYVRKK